MGSPVKAIELIPFQQGRVRKIGKFAVGPGGKNLWNVALEREIRAGAKRCPVPGQVGERDLR